MFKKNLNSCCFFAKNCFAEIFISKKALNETSKASFCFEKEVILAQLAELHKTNLPGLVHLS